MIEITKAAVSDLNQVMNLIEEQAVYHEKEKQAVKTDINVFEKYLFETQQLDCFVAKDGPNLLGIAVCYETFSTWKGLCYHLDELIVTESARGLGLGKKLFNHCIAKAKKNGAKKFDWIVHKRNTNAISFYKKHEAEIDDNWYIGKIDIDE